MKNDFDKISDILEGTTAVRLRDVLNEKLTPWNHVNTSKADNSGNDIKVTTAGNTMRIMFTDAARKQKVTVLATVKDVDSCVFLKLNAEQ